MMSKEWGDRLVQQNVKINFGCLCLAYGVAECVSDDYYDVIQLLRLKGMRSLFCSCICFRKK